MPIDLHDPQPVHAQAAALARDAHRATFSDADAAAISSGVARGDPAALDRLYRAWFDRALALARRFTGRDESFCLDVVQDTMLRAIRALRAQPTGAALDGWLTLGVRSAAVDALRRDGRRILRERACAAPVLPSSPSVPGPCPEDLESILRHLADLDPAEAEVLRRRFAGASLRGIAGASDRTVGAVHGSVRRALAALRQAVRAPRRENLP